MQAGAEFGIATPAIAPSRSLRLEKGYRAWGSDIGRTTRRSRRASAGR